MYTEIIFVQDGDLMTKCDLLMAGSAKKVLTPFWDDNGEAVIDYLRQWDMPENVSEPKEEKPRIARFDTSYSKDGYTLLYNITIGGAYLLYRESTEEEIDNLKNK